jgi:hypothetical protein
MNQLSWLLYGASVADNLRVFAALGFMAGAVAAPVAQFLRDGGARKLWDQEMENHLHYRSLYPNPPTGERPEAPFPYRPYAKAALIVALACIAIRVVIPPKDTLYAIAASQTGEQMIKSPTAQKVVQALDAWLDRQIARKAD